MFCKNCGSEILNGEKFCGSCGQQQSSSVGNSGGVVPPIRVTDSGLIKLFKNYFIKPVSFFSELKGEDLVKTSATLIIGLPIIYGLLNILYSSALMNSIFGMFKKLPDLLAKANILTKDQALQAQKELLISDQMLSFKNKIDNLIDNKDIFLNGMVQILAIMIVTGIILAILNSIILKNKIQLTDILFLSTVSYIPLVLSMVLTILATFISITFGLLILGCGYILSFITLYSGIKEFSEAENDKVFILMTILFILISAILSICIVTKVESSLMSITSTFDYMKRLF